MAAHLKAIDPILRIADICDLLKISPSQFFALREEGFFDRLGLLREIEPQLDRHKRYSGEPFVEWLSDRHQQRLFRQRVQALELVQA